MIKMDLRTSLSSLFSRGCSINHHLLGGSSQDLDTWFIIMVIVVVPFQDRATCDPSIHGLFCLVFMGGDPITTITTYPSPGSPSSTWVGKMKPTYRIPAKLKIYNPQQLEGIGRNPNGKACLPTMIFEMLAAS